MAGATSTSRSLNTTTAIGRLMEIRQMSPDDLCAASGVARPTLTHFQMLRRKEGRLVIPTPETVARLAFALRVRARDVLADHLKAAETEPGVQGP